LVANKAEDKVAFKEAESEVNANRDEYCRRRANKPLLFRKKGMDPRNATDETISDSDM
jgi:hypothetical protein